MNTTCEIFPATLSIGNVPESTATVPQDAADRVKAELPWDLIRALLVLMVAVTLTGLWGWTFVEWVRLTVDLAARLNEAMVLR
jgi:hypothetical protein